MTDIERLTGVQGALEMLANIMISDSRMCQTSSDLSDLILGMAQDVSVVIQHIRKVVDSKSETPTE